ncbi:PAS domain-containing sensor histidine kinase [Rugamonas apoptosis]|uniref:PAS domain S-box protein n=1 Tax=Rugamonas apoptosis TaxID=2758570 RepID=A0A7W2ILY0_9BURK|nr:PAS domain S-box protein [Rugamonas apoptosis]MBA5689280.1 PAS domain S-box protein [Rugamonas apoptosis]
MKTPADAALDLHTLRRNAEWQAARSGAAADDGGQHEALRQLHELQVSQIELELQHEALTALWRQRDAAEADLNQYAMLYDQAPAAYLSVDRDGVISRANLAAGVLLGRAREQLMGRALEQFVAPEGQPTLRRFLAELFACGARSVLEVPLFGSAERVARLEANLDEAKLKCRMIVTDMGDQHARDAARRRAFVVLDSIEEGVLVCDARRRIVAVNPAFTKLTGYLAEEALGRDPAFLRLPDAHPLGYHAQAMRQLLQTGTWQGEVYNVKRDGTRLLTSMSLTVVRADDGRVDYFIGVFSDITERKRAEQALINLSHELDQRVVERTAALTTANLRLQQEAAERERAEAALLQSREQLRKLADHVVTVKENERKRIAREIHDELGQNLLALRLDIAALRARAGGRHPRLSRRVDLVLDNVDATIRSVRGIMNELRPAVLDLGLQAAFEWQVGEWRKRSGVPCRLLLPDEAVLAAIEADVGMVLFRSLQESLLNVQRHAQASDVEVRLRAHGGLLELRVTDNGVGIAPAQRNKNGSFGLIGIAERVAALGGRFQLEPYVPGRGCALTIDFALASA